MQLRYTDLCLVHKHYFVFMQRGLIKMFKMVEPLHPALPHVCVGQTFAVVENDSSYPNFLWSKSVDPLVSDPCQKGQSFSKLNIQYSSMRKETTAHCSWNYLLSKLSNFTSEWIGSFGATSPNHFSVTHCALIVLKHLSRFFQGMVPQNLILSCSMFSAKPVSSIFLVLLNHISPIFELLNFICFT